MVNQQKTHNHKSHKSQAGKQKKTSEKNGKIAIVEISSGQHCHLTRLLGCLRFRRRLTMILGASPGPFIDNILTYGAVPWNAQTCVLQNFYYYSNFSPVLPAGQVQCTTYKCHLIYQSGMRVRPRASFRCALANSNDIILIPTDSYNGLQISSCLRLGTLLRQQQLTNTRRQVGHLQASV